MQYYAYYIIIFVYIYVCVPMYLYLNSCEFRHESVKGSSLTYIQIEPLTPTMGTF